MKPYPLYEHPNFTSFPQLLDWNAERHGAEDAFRFWRGKEIVTVSYLQFQKDVMALAAFLRQVFQGEKIALLGENSYEWIVAYFATAISGNIIVPLDKELPDADIAALLDRCKARALIYAESYSDTAESVSGKVDKLLAMTDFPAHIQEGKKLLKGGRQFLPCGETAVCSIIFTSGTTGEPKGVMLTQRSLVVDAVGGCRNVTFSGPGLLTLPLHHTFAFTATVLVMLVYGLPICISRSIRMLTADIQAFKPQSIALVPLYVETVYHGIWKAAKEKGKDRALKVLIAMSNALRKVGIDLRKRLFRSVIEQFGGELDLLISGGAALKQSYIDGMEAFGIQVLNGYGITECSPVVAVNRNQYQRSGSIGLPLSCCEVESQDGEICVKGDIVMAGYFEDEAATREVLTDGWFHTGDLGYLDEDGFLFITGRKKNLIILSNGKNVAPEKLEEKILDIPGVREALVYEENGQITAEIYAEREDGIRDGVADLNRRLPAYKQIQKIKFRDSEFEKTTTKKIKR